MKIHRTCTRTLTLGLAAAALATGVTTAATLAPADAPLAPSAAQAADPVPGVSVQEENGVNGPAVANAIASIRTGDRGAFVQQAVQAAFDQDGGDYNVVLMNLDQGYSGLELEGVRLYASVTYGAIHYGLWITEAGTFRNTGDGGYINWGFQGWYDRPDAGTVVFHRP